VALFPRVGIPAMIDDRAGAPFGLAFVGDAGHTRFAGASVLAGDRATKPRVDFHWWQRGIGYRSKDF
jgi:hypothetical protein